MDKERMMALLRHALTEVRYELARELARLGYTFSWDPKVQPQPYLLLDRCVVVPPRFDGEQGHHASMLFIVPHQLSKTGYSFLIHEPGLKVSLSPEHNSEGAIAALIGKS